jgi:hypothetical protein
MGRIFAVLFLAVLIAGAWLGIGAIRLYTTRGDAPCPKEQLSWSVAAIAAAPLGIYMCDSGTNWVSHSELYA